MDVRTPEDGTEVNQSVNVAPEDSVKRGGPKKLFKWNEEIRSKIIISQFED